MGWLDLVILSVVGLFGLMGVKSGFLVRASGIAGLVLGIFLAVQHHGQLANGLAEQIDDERVRRAAAFIGIVLVTTVAGSLTGTLVKRLLSSLALGWVDYVVGGLAGAALATIGLGTAVYIIDGANIAGARNVIGASPVAMGITSASLISASTPWCSDLEAAAETPKVESTTAPALLEGSVECTDLTGLAEQLFGFNVSDKVSEVLGQDVETLAEVAKAGFSGSSEELTELVKPQQDQQ